MEARARLLRLLNDREFVSGPVLGQALGISRAAVHKHILHLRQSGLPVDRVPGRGYRLSRNIVPLDERAILENLSDNLRASLGGLLIEQTVDSTSEVLRSRSKDRDVHALACIAESQSSGRGRRGNRWVASPFRNLMLSLGWVYQQWPRTLTGLGPAVGITVVDALSGLGIRDLGVKWPNDIVHEGRKLGGVLIDVSGEANSACTVIVGVGVNVHITERDGACIDQPWTDLVNGLECSVDRNRLATACITHLFSLLSAYEENGFDRYRQRWNELDVLSGRKVSVEMHDRGDEVTGTVTGVDADGALRVRRRGGKEISCYHGEVSIRAA